MHSIRPRRLTSLLLAATALGGFAGAAIAAPAQHASVIRGSVDDRDVVSLSGDVVRAPVDDKGALDPSGRIDHARLVLKRSPEMQRALDTLVASQQQRGKPQYHQWLKPADLRAYGPAQADIDAISNWLGAHNLTVNKVAASGMTIDFGGTIGNIGRAFGTELHHVVWKGQAHIANSAAPTLPRALQDLVAGVTLNDFHPRPRVIRTPNFTTTSPNSGKTYYAVSPQDFNTIYGVSTLQGGHNQFGAPITGAGVTIAVIEDTDILQRDFTDFRARFGLSGYAGTLTQVNPGCGDPGRNADEVEAALDAEWAGVAAPDANIVLAACQDGQGILSGITDAMAGVVESTTLKADIISVSYGLPVALTGYGYEAEWANLTEEAASEGIAVQVASGDAGSSADRNQIDGEGLDIEATSGTPNNLSVGGTDFLDTSLGTTAQYWQASNSATGQSVLSYVPETTWNESCASPLVAQAFGFATPIAACNAATPPGAPGVGGTGSRNTLYPKPSWQAGIPGVLNDKARDEPDVSLFSSSGIFRHFLLLCMSDRAEGGSPCYYHNFNDLAGNAAGGTSFAAPAMSGIIALLVQAEGARIGNAAPILYQLAAAQYDSKTGLKQCNATLGNGVGGACAFYNVTNGTNAQPCYAGSPNCQAGSAATNGIGILVDPKTGLPAYTNHRGYSPANGLGSVNATNLVYQFIVNGL